jgi:ABC-type glycerol-3-phosphate transport system substrate-binding protein
MKERLSRRRFLGTGVVAAIAGAAVVACSSGGSSASPTAAPAATSAATSSASASSGASASPTTAASSASSTQATPASQASSAAPVTLTLMDFSGVGWEQDPKFTKMYEQAHPNVTVKEQPTLYNDMFQKCLTLATTGTLADLFAGHNKWMPYLYYKQICLELDSLVKEHSADINFPDIFPSVIADAKGVGANGKLYILPTVLHPGGNAIVIFNLDLLGKAGVDAPTSSDWTINDFENIIRKAANPKAGIFGTNVIYNSPLYADQVTRTWGAYPDKPDINSWLLSPDGKKQQLGNPEVKASFQWYWQLIKDGLVPTSAVAPPSAPGGDFFIAGQLATTANIVGEYGYYVNTIKDKFKFSAVLWPKGPHGYRGSCLSYNTYAIYAKTKDPEASFGLLGELTGTAIGQWAAISNGVEPYARYSVWDDPNLWKIIPVTKDAAAWLKAGVDPFPQPWNMRFTQWLDAWTQDTSKYLNGQADWNQFYNQTQQACQAILDMPRP